MRIPLFAAALLTLAACSDSPTGTNDTGLLATRISNDVATVAADATAEDVDVMAGLNGLNGNFTVNLVDGLTPPIGPGNVTGCGFGSGRFSCPPNSANGLTVTRTVAFYDGQNAVQQAYDALLTAKIEVAATLQGDVTRGTWTATISRTRNFVHTGLLGTEASRTTNGTATGTAARSRISEGGNNRSYEMSESATFVDVVVPVRAEGVAPWPTSGTVTRVVTVTPEGGTSVTRTVIITFNGTATPTATVNGEAFTLNLGNRTAQRRLSGATRHAEAGGR